MIYPDEDEATSEFDPEDEYDVAEIRGAEDLQALEEEGYLNKGVSVETALMKRGLDRMEREE